MGGDGVRGKPHPAARRYPVGGQTDREGFSSPASHYLLRADGPTPAEDMKAPFPENSWGCTGSCPRSPEEGAGRQPPGPLPGPPRRGVRRRAARAVRRSCGSRTPCWVAIIRPRPFPLSRPYASLERQAGLHASRSVAFSWSGRSYHAPSQLISSGCRHCSSEVTSAPWESRNWESSVLPLCCTK